MIDQYDMSADMWRDRIKRWWSRNAGQSREEAELEYLRVAQDLEMYGILYYPICVSFFAKFWRNQLEKLVFTIPEQQRNRPTSWNISTRIGDLQGCQSDNTSTVFQLE